MKFTTNFIHVRGGYYMFHFFVWPSKFANVFVWFFSWQPRESPEYTMKRKGGMSHPLSKVLKKSTRLTKKKHMSHPQSSWIPGLCLVMSKNEQIGKRLPFSLVWVDHQPDRIDRGSSCEVSLKSVSWGFTWKTMSFMPSLHWLIV